METSLTITNSQFEQIRAHLFDPDGLEGVAILLCGRSTSANICRFMVHQVHCLPHSDCTRTAQAVTWPTRLIEPLLDVAQAKGLAVIKIHSHRVDFRSFSDTDDRADAELFPTIYAWLDSDMPHGSAVLLPDGEILIRTVASDGTFLPGSKVLLIGDDLKFSIANAKASFETANQSDIKNAQAFGPGTVSILKRLRVGVVGCSGTGAPTIEQLARLGVGSLVLVDDDKIKEKNLNRITYSTSTHAQDGAFKVDVLRSAIESIGTGIQVSALPKPIHDPEAIRALSTCDILFGCVDSVDGRHILNKISTFYSIPYIDVGVRLEADGKGGIDQICGSINYLQPGKSTLLSRNVYTSAQLDAAMLERSDPERHASLLREKYITGVNVDRPAVISVNYLFSALAVNELLARLHGYRIDANENFAQVMLSISIGAFFLKAEADFVGITGQEKYVGRGNMEPLLDMAL